jgi:hypothetical protein
MKKIILSLAFLFTTSGCIMNASSVNVNVSAKVTKNGKPYANQAVSVCGKVEYQDMHFLMAITLLIKKSAAPVLLMKKEIWNSRLKAVSVIGPVMEISTTTLRQKLLM